TGDRSWWQLCWAAKEVEMYVQTRGLSVQLPEGRTGMYLACLRVRRRVRSTYIQGSWIRTRSMSLSAQSERKASWYAMLLCTLHCATETVFLPKFVRSIRRASHECSQGAGQ